MISEHCEVNMLMISRKMIYKHVEPAIEKEDLYYLRRGLTPEVSVEEPPIPESKDDYESGGTVLPKCRLGEK